MRNIVTDAVLAAIANPGACDLEALRSDDSVIGTANAVESAIRQAGAVVLNRYSDSVPPTPFTPPLRERVVFRAAPSSGYPRRRDHFLLVPALQAIIEKDGDEVWLRFDRAERLHSMPMDHAA